MTDEALHEWLMADFEPDSLRVLEDREEEPNFQPIIEKARERAKGDSEDAALIRELLGIILHLDNTLDAYYYNMSDNRQLPEGA
jgi:hypothetical protein